MLDIMYIDGNPILHIFDSFTRFSVALFLRDVLTKTVSETIIECCSIVYTGLPSWIRINQRSRFQDSIVTVGRALGVDVAKSGIESHNALGIRERYYHPIRNTFRKLNKVYPNASDAVLLSISVKALNDTVGPEGLVPSALVVGEYPSTRVFDEPPVPRVTLQPRTVIGTQARRAMEQEMARLRV